MIAIVAERLKTFLFDMRKAVNRAVGCMTRMLLLLLFVCFLQSELSFLRNQLEESKLQQQELADSIEEKVRCSAWQ